MKKHSTDINDLQWQIIKKKSESQKSKKTFIKNYLEIVKRDSSGFKILPKGWIV
jgi:hypothetical protein